MSQCECMAAGEPRDVIDLYTPLYQALGGRLYRLHVTTDASAVLMGDGVSVETRLLGLERSLLTNTTTYFADTIAQRDKVAPLTAGDRCYVFDATGDDTVPYGSAMYIWLPSRKWHKLYNGDSPIEAQNLIVPGAGLGVRDNKLYVKGGDIIAAGKGLLASDDKLMVNMADLIAASKGLGTDASGKLYVRLADLLGTGGGLATGSDGKLKVDFSQLPATDLGSIASGIASSGGGLTTGADGKLKVNAAALAGNGLSAGSDGKLNVDFSAMPDAQMRSVVLAMVQSGGGISVDSSGKLYVDYDTMPDTRMQAVLETFRKGLRLQKWQTGNKTFHVNASTGSDTLDEGRGESESKPFKSIQACINYVCNNYNIGNYQATISVANGAYGGPLTLPDFTRNSGAITIKGASGNRAGVVVSGTSLTGSMVRVDGGNWTLQDMTIEHRPDISDFGGVYNPYTQIVSVSSGQLVISGLRLRFLPTGTPPANGVYTSYGLFSQVGANLIVAPGLNKTSVENNATASDNLRVMAISCAGGDITFNGTDNDSLERNFEVSGNFTRCCEVNGGLVTFRTSRKNKAGMTCQGSQSGQRYLANNGGRINTDGGGASFFPGVTEGSVEASTYSWYK